VTKGVTNTCLLLLLDKGLLNYDDLVSSHWPEFAQNGKENIAIKELLTHRAGLSHFDSGPIPLDIIHKIGSPENSQRKKEFSQFLASQKLKWQIQPNVCGYHAFSVGFFVAELFQRVDPKRRSPSTFLQEEICAKIKADYYMGIDDSFENRLSRHYYQKISINPKDETTRVMMDKTSLAWQSHNSIHKFNVWKYRQYEIPSAIGFASATGVAAIYSILANNGTVDGHTFITNPSSISLATKSIGKCKDLVLIQESHWTQGGFRVHPTNPDIVWHAGWGGSLGWVDIKNKISVGYVTNKSRVDPDGVKYCQGPRQSAILDAVYRSLSKTQKPAKL